MSNTQELINHLSGCIYYSQQVNSDYCYIRLDMAEGIRKLLEDREPVKPESDPNYAGYIDCGNCKCVLGFPRFYKFCPRCGREVDYGV